MSELEDKKVVLEIGSRYYAFASAESASVVMDGIINAVEVDWIFENGKSFYSKTKDHRSVEMHQVCSNMLFSDFGVVQFLVKNIIKKLLPDLTGEVLKKLVVEVISLGGKSEDSVKSILIDLGHLKAPCENRGFES